MYLIGNISRPEILLIAILQVPFFVVLNTMFKLVSFCTLLLSVVYSICISRLQFSYVNLHAENEHQVVLAARRRLAAKLTSPFDSSAPI
jgi:hypothetical protein